MGSTGLMKKILAALIFVLPQLLAAQSDITFQEEKSILLFPFGEDESIPSPWNGGLNASQVNTMDLDFDGDDDLVMYDRTAQKILTYLNLDGRYEYAMPYETMFPSGVSSWVLLRDFDGDGLKDIFTGHIFGISVYKNVSDISARQLKWKHFPFYGGNSISEVILTEGLSGRINLQLQFDDLPSISDADNDGDIDIFSMNYGGSGTIELHKNLSIEKYGHNDSLDFELVDNWWGGVRECSCGEFVFKKEACPPGRIEHAGGKSLLLIDGNGDGFKDMLITEGECANMYIIYNTGSIEAPVIAQADNFPPKNPASFNYYPTAYFEDLDFDGTKDLIVTPNLFSKDDATVDFSNTHWFYKNVGSDEQPQFELTRTGFMQDQMLEVGDNAVPAAADIDADGDYDILVSNNGNPSVIRLLENIGSAFEPIFRVTDDDYLALSSQNFTNMRAKIADVDSDGKPDLVFTATRLTESATRVYFLRNKASAGLDFAGQNIEQLDFSLARPENISFIDIDLNGHVDILKGKSSGAVEYWKNTGSELQFVLEDPQYLGMGTGVLVNNFSFAEADLNSDGNPDLIISDQTGKLSLLENFRGADDISDATAATVFDSLTQYYAPNWGGRTWVTTAPLYGAQPVIIVGTTLGGIRLLRNVDDDTIAPVISVYPNPIHLATQSLRITSNQQGVMDMFNAKGQKIRPSRVIPSKSLQTLSLYDISPGMYLLRFEVRGKIVVRRLVVR
jgi:hypothetical protein